MAWQAGARPRLGLHHEAVEHEEHVDHESKRGQAAAHERGSIVLRRAGKNPTRALARSARRAASRERRPERRDRTLTARERASPSPRPRRASLARLRRRRAAAAAASASAEASRGGRGGRAAERERVSIARRPRRRAAPLAMGISSTSVSCAAPELVLPRAVISARRSQVCLRTRTTGSAMEAKAVWHTGYLPWWVVLLLSKTKALARSARRPASLGKLTARGGPSVAFALGPRIRREAGSLDSIHRPNVPSRRNERLRRVEGVCRHLLRPGEEGSHGTRL